MKNKLKVGDEVMWRGGWGSDAPQKARITNIDIYCDGGKYGDEVEECDWDEVTRDNCVVGLDNDHWAYGNQISRI